MRLRSDSYLVGWDEMLTPIGHWGDTALVGGAREPLSKVQGR